jgi:hypothetical protein
MDTRDKLIPDETREAEQIKMLFARHRADPALFGEDFVYVKQ